MSRLPFSFLKSKMELLLPTTSFLNNWTDNFRYIYLFYPHVVIKIKTLYINPSVLIGIAVTERTRPTVLTVSLSPLFRKAIDKIESTRESENNMTKLKIYIDMKLTYVTSKMPKRNCAAVLEKNPSGINSMAKNNAKPPVMGIIAFLSVFCPDKSNIFSVAFPSFSFMLAENPLPLKSTFICFCFHHIIHNRDFS